MGRADIVLKIKQQRSKTVTSKISTLRLNVLKWERNITVNDEVSLGVFNNALQVNFQWCRMDHNFEKLIRIGREAVVEYLKH